MTNVVNFFTATGKQIQCQVVKKFVDIHTDPLDRWPDAKTFYKIKNSVFLILRITGFLCLHLFNRHRHDTTKIRTGIQTLWL